MPSACVLALLTLLALLLPGPAHALEAIVVSPDQKKLDITLLGELYEGRGDTLSVETAADSDGITGRMSVQATTPGTDPNWVVFALTNPTDNQIERILSARRYELAGSKVVWPDLDAPRIARVTPSVGFKPKPIPADQADLFRITLEPKSTVTFIVELRSVDFPRLMLWDGAALGKSAIDRTLLNGILLGIAGLLAIFLTAIFVANHRAVFPATALVAWSVVAYLCVDFGFWHKLFQLSADQIAVYRAGAEAALAASIIIFLMVYLRLRQWQPWLMPVFAGWALLQIGLIAFAVIDAKLTAGLARLSFLPIAGVGTLLVLWQSLRGEDRALTLLPTWMLFLVWLFGAGVAIQGYLAGDIVVPALSSGLVLFVALLGFSVTQYAFHPGDYAASGHAGQFGRGAAALEASGASVWEWDVRREEIKVGPEVERSLGYAKGTLSCGTEDWLQYVHASDRERVKLMLWTVRDRDGGDLEIDLRLRRSDGSYLWYELRGCAVKLPQSQILQCIGLLRDVTAQKRSEERLTHNAVYDALTGQPNRELFRDRATQAILRCEAEGTKPTIIVIDLDQVRGGQPGDVAISDSMLLTVARRLSRHVRETDTLARIGVDQFAMLLTSETDPRYIAMLAERVRRSLRSPMKLSGREVALIGAIGISVYDGRQADGAALVAEAELAAYRAKRAGADRIELYKPDTGAGDERAELEKDLKKAIDGRQIVLLYQPVMRLSDNQLVGFEALLRWNHPKQGLLSPAEFMSAADRSDMTGDLSRFAVERAIRQLNRWQKAWPRADDPLFVTLDISHRSMLRSDAVQDLRTVIGRGTVPENCFWVEVSETIVMENPEQIVEALASLKSVGARLALDEYGSGYSSVAYLHRLPLDVLKIDRSLVRSANSAGADPVILRAVLAMADELGLDVVVQGVDRERDAAYLRALGCDYGQGFYFGEPMTEKEVMNLVNALARAAAKAGGEPRRRTAEKSAAPTRTKPETEAERPPRKGARVKTQPAASDGAPDGRSAAPKRLPPPGDEPPPRSPSNAGRRGLSDRATQDAPQGRVPANANGTSSQRYAPGSGAPVQSREARPGPPPRQRQRRAPPAHQPPPPADEDGWPHELPEDDDGGSAPPRRSAGPPRRR
jgi:diguanylate cyclase (GGDEF)-like protein/PAS domain S-box-containing protein